jgi:hypothetical protein
VISDRTAKGKEKKNGYRIWRRDERRQDERTRAETESWLEVSN